MKQLPVIAVLVFIGSPVFSQISKGQWILGGNASFSHSVVKQKNDVFHSDNKTSSVQAMQGTGYFLITQLAVGLRTGVSYTDVEEESESRNVNFLYTALKSKRTAFSFGPFVRYYFLPSSRKLNVFADASYAYSNNKEKSKVTQVAIPPGGQPMSSLYTSNTKYKSHSYSIAAGPAFFMNPKVSVELTVGYAFTNYDGNTNQKANTLLLGAGFQIHLGK